MDNYENLLLPYGMQLDQIMVERFEKYADLLMEWNEKFNLTAITDREDIYIKHFFDSLLLEGLYHPTGSLLDVGSGAGFPGIPLKIYDDHLGVVLLEPTGKRCSFLNTVIEELKLENIMVENMRAEDHHVKYDYVTARAVAELNILSELCLPLVHKGGHFIAMKGPKAYEEARKAVNGIRLLGGRIQEIREIELPGGQTRIFVDIVKEKETPKGYPRKFALIKKKPL